MKYFCIIILCLNYKFAIRSAHSYKQCDINDYKNNDSAPVILKFPKITNITILNNKNNISEFMLSKPEIENINQHLKINNILFLKFPKSTTPLSCQLKKLANETFPKFSISLTKNNRTYLLLISNNTYNIAQAPILIPQISNIPLEYNINKTNFVLKNVEKFDNNSKFSITCNNCLGQIEDDFNYTNIMINSDVTLNFASKLYCFVYIFHENLSHHETTILNYKHFKVDSTTIHFELPTVTFVADTVVELNFNFSTETKEKRNELTYKLHFTCRDTWCLNVNLTKTVIPQKFLFGQKHFLTLDSLKPFTNYEIFINSKLYNCDAFNDKLKQSLGTYKTLSGKPNKVENLSYYYRNLTHLWIMFEDPYPPRGIIKQYITSLRGSAQNFYPKSHFKECKNNKKFKCGIIKFDNVTKKLNVVIEHDNCTICRGDPAEINVNIFDNKYNKSFIGDVNVTFTNDPNKVLVKFVQPYLKSGPFQISLLTSNNNVKKNIPVEIFNQNYTEQLLANTNFSITLQASNKFEELNKIFYVQIKQIIVETHQFDLIETCNEFSNCVIEVKLPSSLSKVNRANMLISTINESYLNYCLLVNDNSTNKKIKLIGKDDNITMNRFRIYTNESLINSKTHLLVVTSMLNNNCSFYRLDVETSLPSLESPNYIVIGSVFGSLAAITILAIVFFVVYRFRKKVPFIKTKNISLESIFLLANNNTNIVSFNELFINNFRSYVENAIDEQFLEVIEEFNKIPKELSKKSKTIGENPANKVLNRYKNILPYDDTIVPLSKNKYINADFVYGYNLYNTYIATQAPMRNTVADFWQMIWEQNVSTIIMLTELVEDKKTKSEKYWPDLNQSVTYGNFTIRTLKIESFSDYFLSSILIEFDNTEKVVEHFQYVTWPDHDSPLFEEGYLAFLKHVKVKTSPVVVHCSAGCGRTGTFILCDYIIKMIDGKRQFNFPEALYHIRKCRMNLVNNKGQYIFAHLAVYNYLFYSDFSTPVCNFSIENIRNKSENILQTLKTELDQVIKLKLKLLPNFSASVDTSNAGKNRFQQFSPPGHSQVFLNPSSMYSSNYINAVSVPCYRAKDKFIVTQQPLPNTIVDFWRLVDDNDIKLILVLNDFKINDDTPMFYPQNLNESLKIDDGIGEIKTEEIEEDSVIINYRLRLLKERVLLIKLKNWNFNHKVPKNVQNLVFLWQQVWNSAIGNSKIVVCCHDGVTASGLFVALCYVLEQINNEQVCNVFEALKYIKLSRSEFVNSDEQIMCLFEAAQIHIDNFTEYSNFNHF